MSWIARMAARRRGAPGARSGLPALRLLPHRRPVPPAAAQRGGVALETALALVVLVATMAGLMEIVNIVYNQDRLTRAARTAAREIALETHAPATKTALDEVVCRAVRGEFDDEDFDCSRWVINVEAYSTPVELLAGTEPQPESPEGSGDDADSPDGEGEAEAPPLGGEHGDMIRVEIGVERTSWGLGVFTLNANAESTTEEDGGGGENEGDDGDDGSDESSPATNTVKIVATAVARNEREITF